MVKIWIILRRITFIAMSPYSILVEKVCDFSGVVFATKTSASFSVVAKKGSIFLEINPLSDDLERLSISAHFLRSSI